ncbi:MAG: hypothetical protein DWI22_06595 [Planctomycetota bacterium]|nr:MAG: hypothetical protein DWI22_06595 [Planctomycetota bacterium]
MQNGPSNSTAKTQLFTVPKTQVHRISGVAHAGSRTQWQQYFVTRQHGVVRKRDISSTNERSLHAARIFPCRPLVQNLCVPIEITSCQII